MKAWSVILGSASPRRKEILGEIIPRFEVRVSDANERCLLTAPAQYVLYTAAKKSLAIPLNAGELLLTADTIVCLGTHFLGKPRDDADARRMLLDLNHRVNTVYTGVCLRTLDKIDLFYEASDVRIDMTDAEIDAYVATGSPLDKAGAYGIQDPNLNATLLAGSIENVIGLPKAMVAKHLAAFGIEENYV